jgi:hypothetical protein
MAIFNTDAPDVAADRFREALATVRGEDLTAFLGTLTRSRRGVLWRTLPTGVAVCVSKHTVGYRWAIGPGRGKGEAVHSRTSYPTEIAAVLALLAELEKAPLRSGRALLDLPRPESKGRIPES